MTIARGVARKLCEDGKLCEALHLIYLQGSGYVSDCYEIYC